MIILVQRVPSVCVSVCTRARVTLRVHVSVCVSSDSRFYQVYNSRYLQGVSKVTSKNNQQGGYNITR